MLFYKWPQISGGTLQSISHYQLKCYLLKLTFKSTPRYYAYLKSTDRCWNVIKFYLFNYLFGYLNILPGEKKKCFCVWKAPPPYIIYWILICNINYWSAATLNLNFVDFSGFFRISSRFFTIFFIAYWIVEIVVLNFNFQILAPKL